MRKRLLVPAILFVALSPVAPAHGGWTHCGDADFPWATYYVVPVSNSWTGGAWTFVYEESNGIPHLQRGGGSYFVPGEIETCVELPTTVPDLIVS